MQAAEPDDPQDAVVAQQVNCFSMEAQLLCPWMPECQMQVKMLTLMTLRSRCICTTLSLPPRAYAVDGVPCNHGCISCCNLWGNVKGL